MFDHKELQVSSYVCYMYTRLSQFRCIDEHQLVNGFKRIQQNTSRVTVNYCVPDKHYSRPREGESSNTPASFTLQRTIASRVLFLKSSFYCLTGFLKCFRFLFLVP